MDAHRKIDLQSPQDLTYIASNIRDAAQQRIDEHLATSSAPKAKSAAFRATVDALVQQYVTDSLTLALPSASINGLDASPAQLNPAPADSSTADPSDPAYEPYDARLAERLRTLHAELEAETTRVAQLRRDAPAKASAAYLERLQQDMAAEAAAYEEARKKVGQAESGGEELAGVGLEREEGVRKAYEAARKEVESLRDVTETVATLERAERAWREVERL